MAVEETMRKRREDHGKLELKLRENAFVSLRAKSEKESEFNSMRQSIEADRGQ